MKENEEVSSTERARVTKSWERTNTEKLEQVRKEKGCLSLGLAVVFIVFLIICNRNKGLQARSTMEDINNSYFNESSIQNLQAEYGNRKFSIPGDFQELDDADTVFHVSKKDDSSDDVSVQSSLSDVNSNNQNDELMFVEQLLFERKLDDVIKRRSKSVVSNYLQSFQDELSKFVLYAIDVG